jgi:hypothetical protein
MDPKQWTPEDVRLEDEADDDGEWNVWLGPDTIVAWSMDRVVAQTMADNLRIALKDGK